MLGGIVSWLDFTNGLFEIVGGCLVWLNIRQIRRDKVLKGISIFPIAFFTAWGYWNVLIYYPSYRAWFSAIGALNVTLANSIWVTYMIYFRRKYRGLVVDHRFLPRERWSDEKGYYRDHDCCGHITHFPLNSTLADVDHCNRPRNEHLHSY